VFPELESNCYDEVKIASKNIMQQIVFTTLLVLMFWLVSVLMKTYVLQFHNVLNISEIRAHLLTFVVRNITIVNGINCWILE